MGLADRIERRLESSVGDAFARVFGGSLVPQEVEALLRREAEAHAREVGGGRILAPNDYVITLSNTDYQNVSADPERTSSTFARHLQGFIHDQGWQTYGDVVVRFEAASTLHTGQFRARGAVNPDSSTGTPAPPQHDRPSTAQPGVPAMTDNPSYRGQGQGRPGDEQYDERYRQQDDRGGYPPEHGAHPDQGGYPPRQGGYPDQGYPPPAPPSYEQRPPAGYGQPPAGYPDQGYRQQPPAGYPQPPASPPPGYGEYDYGRPPAPPRPDEGYGRPPAPQAPSYEPPSYPDQGGYPDQGYGRDYGRQDYAAPAAPQAPDYGRYGEPPAAPGYPDTGYGEPEGYGQGYGQPAGAGYGQDYGQGYGAEPAGPAAYGGYAGAGATVTLQLDDGSGRTYQLREGANVIGRGQDAQFRLPDTGVSRRHLEIRWDGQVALLSDLNSTNGTTVNNAPVQEWQLADGDVIRLGHSEIIVRVH
ncbi:FhaA domain-containing protein [Mycolicibacterium sp. 120266]|uniref:FhaA domain-containing protein n=1 Tax=Mycolicibacterium sp. 120266 TaxID=3090601 RepID=UPI00299DE208|nr:FhaA domain-containing protein [Mycolicibacterium sp. 120266]MDX1873379.1 FhaA domain-containing protein [Mycolicibacterium sp. 120266]